MCPKMDDGSIENVYKEFWFPLETCNKKEHANKNIQKEWCGNFHIWGIKQAPKPRRYARIETLPIDQPNRVNTGDSSISKNCIL